MQYLSPFSLLPDASKGSLDKKAIQLARKKLFAELELSGKDSIAINGQLFTRNDIIACFDNLQNEQFFDYHRAIAQDKVLLPFLETTHIGRWDRFRDNPLYKDDFFITWISPYFFDAFISCLENCFLELDENTLTEILNNPLLMTETDTEKAWAGIEKKLANNIAILEYHDGRSRVDKKLRIPLDDIVNLMDYRYINLIRLLPENRFGSARDKYAWITMEVCIHIFNRDQTNRDYAKTTIENARIMAVSEQMKNEIAKKREEMNKVSRRKNYRYARTIVIAIAVIASIVDSSTKSNNYPIFNNNPVIFVPSRDTGLLKDSAFDSILRTRTNGAKKY